MLNKKIIFLLLLIICLLIPPAVFANDNVTISDNFGTQYAAPDSFSKLNEVINNNTDKGYVELQKNYTYNPECDSDFKNGITINRPLNIMGLGITINGYNQARIFNITSDNVFISNVNFINAKSDNGGAIIGNNYGVINCNFSNNAATKSGGAIYGGTATDCIFTNNSARDGGSLYMGSSINSRFIENSARYGGALYRTYAENSIFISNHAEEYSGAMESGSSLNCIFINNYADMYGAGGFYADNCTFVNNTANIAGALYGGAINCRFIGNSAEEVGALVPVGEIKNCTFTNNHAKNGGAIGGNGESVINCTFINNSADDTGGALNCIYAVNCVFKYNSANVGGALYEGSALNCTFISNSAIASSGAVYGSVDFCTFISNTAQNGGAIASGSAKNSIFEGNSAEFGGALYCISSLNCTFNNNHAINEGGAMYGGSAVDCNFNSNHAQYGGAIAGSCSAMGSQFINNVAEMSGGAEYKSSTVNCYFEGNLPKYKLYVSDFEAIYGFGGEISIKLSDSPYNQVKGIKTTVKIYNSNNNLVETGTCYSGYSYFIDLNVGKYTAHVSVDDERYNADTAISNINIKKATSIYVVNVVAIYNINNPLIVNLHDSNGVILKNTHIKITVNGITKVYLTNNNGQVLFSTKGLVPKTYSAAILYSGNNIYAQSSASAKIIVKKANPIMLAYKQTFKVNDKIKKYTITLKNNLYKVMRNTLVTLKVNGKNYYAKTNLKGQATFKIIYLKKKGNFKAVVRYSGNNCFNAFSRTVVFTVR